MRRTAPTLIGLLALGACSSAGGLPPAFATAIAEMPEDTPARLAIVGDRIVTVAIATGPGAVPAVVRVAIDAVEPGGDTLFLGREWGERGTGYRVDKRYDLPGQEHTRSVLVAADGHVLERAHSVPIAEVPQPVLATALEAGPTVAQAMIVSGPESEESWQCLVTDRIGHTYVVTTALDGRLLRTARRVAARIDG